MTKMKEKTFITRILIYGGVAVAIIVAAVLHLIILWAAPPSPAITYGEFSFKLEYEKQGRHYIIEDVLVAEFNRSISGSVNGEGTRIWSTSLKSGDSQHFTIRDDESVRITFFTGNSSYFMDDLELGRRRSKSQLERIWSKPSIHIDAVNEYGEVSRYSILIEDSYDLLREHGIRLISWERDEPIVNSFK